MAGSVSRKLPNALHSTDTEYACIAKRQNNGVSAPPNVIAARAIPVAYAKPWLSTETELDEYLQQQRAAGLKEILTGNRVQI